MKSQPEEISFEDIPDLHPKEQKPIEVQGEIINSKGEPYYYAEATTGMGSPPGGMNYQTLASVHELFKILFPNR